MRATSSSGFRRWPRALDAGLAPRAVIVELHLGLLAAVPDTLIARKRGRGAAERVSAGAARGPRRRRRPQRRGARGHRGVRRLAAPDGNALNPGTTADLVTAVLFVALLEGRL